MELSQNIVNNEAHSVVLLVDGDVDLICGDFRKGPDIVVDVTLVECNIWNFNRLQHLKNELC